MFEEDAVSSLSGDQFGEVVRLIHLASPLQLVQVVEQIKIRKVILDHALQPDWREVEQDIELM
jgi:hypothetical protein